jgi:hypothetical protein
VVVGPQVPASQTQLPANAGGTASTLLQYANGGMFE